MLIVIDTHNTPISIIDLLTHCGYWERIFKLSTRVVVIDHLKRCWHDEVNTLPDIEPLWNETRYSQNQYFVLVEASQLFFDVDITTKALKKFSAKNADYFTQWEHCRLPIGIGVRAFSLDLLRKLQPRNLQSFLATIQNSPEMSKFLYDNERYVSYDISLLDARYSPSLDHIFNQGVKISSWDLKGFLDLINKSGANLVYSNDQHSSFVDERLMPAAYGFESNNCAGFPTYIMFDLTNKCNSSCVHCPHAVGFKGSEKKIFLNPAYFNRVIDECANYPIDFIRITADGEPTLHPDLWQMLDYCTNKGVGPVGLTTNGSLLNRKNTEALIDSRIFMVDISLDAFTEETYGKIRRGLRFENTKRNIENLLNLKEKRQSPLKVMLSFVKQKNNVHETNIFQKFWESRVDKVLIREMISNVGMVEIDNSDGNKGLKRWPCPHWFRRVVIDYNGKIKACPIDWQGETTYLSISETSIHSAWHSDFYHQKRLAHLNQNLEGTIGCCSCNDWSGTPWTLGYEKVIRSLKAEPPPRN